MTGPGRNLAVEAGGNLYAHKGHPCGAVLEVHLVDLSRFGRTNALGHLDSLAPEGSCSLSRDERIWVADCIDHFAHTGPDQSIRAGRGSALVAAGLQRDIDGRSAR